MTELNQMPACSKPLLCDVFSFGISTKKDTLTLRKSTYKILPKIKFKRKNEKKILLEKVDIASYKINIPFTVGGGIKTEEDVSILLQNGADKISVNTAAFLDPSIIKRFAKNFGSQCVVLAIDAKCEADNNWYVYLKGGREKTEMLVTQWAKMAVDLGVGEILLTSMNHDGTKQGFALDITATLADSLPVPIIASGGGGTAAHFYDVFTKGKADAALAASIFHYKEIAIPDLKSYLHEKGIPIRL